MPGVYLTQAEADALIAIEKHRVSETVLTFPESGRGSEAEFVSANGMERFLLNLHRGQARLSKMTYNLRGRQTVVLVRLDLGAAPHRNPNGERIAGPHIHIYREGYEAKWAYPLSATDFPAPSDLVRTLKDFMRYCNITKPPEIWRALW